MKEIVTFGEIMLRLSTKDSTMLSETNFRAGYGGAEANVAVALAHLGLTTTFITKLPQNDLGMAALDILGKHGVRTSEIVFGGDRLGLYFLETGHAMRTRKVLYDRANSSFSGLGPNSFNWQTILGKARWFHWSGITPAVSQGAAECCKQALIAAKKANVWISADINYRPQLWNYGQEPKTILGPLLSNSRVLILDPAAAQQSLGVKLPGIDLVNSKLTDDQLKTYCKHVTGLFPEAEVIAFTMRDVISNIEQRVKGYLYFGEMLLVSHEQVLNPVVDRIGSGDAFASGLIYGLLQFPEDHQRVLNFAFASFCLKHSISGDFNLISAKKINSLANTF